MEAHTVMWKPLPDPRRGLDTAEPLSWGPAALGKKGTEPPASTSHCWVPALNLLSSHGGR